MKINFLLLFFCVVFKAHLYAQELGQWRMHINYDNVIDIAYSETNLMAATEKSVFLLDYEDYSTQILDKSNVLSDYGIRSIAYDSSLKTYIILYTNSNMDLLKGRTITNLPDIKNKLTASSKNINDVYIRNGFAYISTDFGIVKLNIDLEEVENTYIIGATGNQVRVLDCTVANDTLYALTSQGLKAISLQANNVLDFSQWNHSIPTPTGLTEIETFENKLYGISTDFLTFENGNWQSLYSYTTPLKELTASSSLTYIANTQVYSYNTQTLDTLNTSFLIAPTICVNVNNTYYFGDDKFGLFKEREKIGITNSPFTHQGFNGVSYGRTIAISSGGFNDNIDGIGNTEGGFYIFKEGYWENYNIYNYLGGNGYLQDYNRIAYNPLDHNLYIALFSGLLSVNTENNQVQVYNASNSPIDSALLNPGVQKVTGVAIDESGNVWCLNPETDHALLVKTPENVWKKFAVGNDNRKMNTLLIDDYNQKWISIYRQGITVFKEGDGLSSAGAQSITLTTNGNQGNLPNATVYCMTLDKEGEVWVGTAEGIAVFSCPSQVFDATSSCRVSTRITNTLDDYTEYLFATDRVNAIEVDGANRKWIGTSAGLFLMSSDGKTQLLSFNKENSPLPSNFIYDITINKSTGEVFIFTDKGIVSYMSDATEPSESYENIKAYPNPVRPDYTGLIAIEGLVDDAYVKITDTHGVLIKEGYALGGKFVWDGKNYNGKRANTGVYYVFTGNTSTTVKKKASTKIAIIR